MQQTVKHTTCYFNGLNNITYFEDGLLKMSKLIATPSWISRMSFTVNQTPESWIKVIESKYFDVLFCFIPQ